MSLLNEMLRNLDARRPKSPDVDDGVVTANHFPQNKNGFLPPFVFLTIVIILGAIVLLVEFPLLDSKTDAHQPVARTPQGRALPTTLTGNPREEGTTDELTVESQPAAQHAQILLNASVAPEEATQQSVMEADTAPKRLPDDSSLTTSIGVEGTLPEQISITNEMSVLQAPATSYAVQIMALEDEKKLLRYAASISLADPIIVKTRTDDRQSYVLLLGVYIDQQSAKDASDQWIRSNRVVTKNWIRSIVPLQDAISTGEASESRQETQSVETTTAVRQIPARTEKELLVEVDKLLRENAASEARERLESYLVSNPESVAAAKALFRVYLALDDLEMADRLLNGRPRLPSLTALELTAQLKVHQEDMDGAIRLLETVTPDYSRKSYYALLASLYQKVRRYREAADHYRILLNNEPDQGVFWLGFAVSMDSLHDDEQALLAFRRTMSTGFYDGEVKRYVEERIRILSQ